MTTAILNKPALDLRKLAGRGSPRVGRFDPFGLVTGYKAYRIYEELAWKTDAELAELGLTRADLPRVAFDAAHAR